MRKIDMATRYQFRVSIYLLVVAIAALTAKGWLLAARVIVGCPTVDEYDYEERGGKVYAVHRRSGPMRQIDQSGPFANRGR
jgi:hypothetical protein